MAFEAFIPKVVNFTGDDAFLEGADYRRTLTVKKLVGGVEVPVNMTEYNVAGPVIVLKDKVTEDGGVTSNCPTGTCVWTDAAGGTFQLDIVAAQTNSGPGASSPQKFSGTYDITVVFDDAPDSGKKAVIFTGAWAITKTTFAS